MLASDSSSFGEVVERLDQIVSEVRAKDVSLERSLDLLDEAIRLGSRAVELVDSTDLSAEELTRAQAQREKGPATQEQGGPVEVE